MTVPRRAWTARGWWISTAPSSRTPTRKERRHDHPPPTGPDRGRPPGPFRVRQDAIERGARRAYLLDPADRAGRLAAEELAASAGRHGQGHRAEDQALHPLELHCADRGDEVQTDRCRLVLQRGRAGGGAARERRGVRPNARA